MDESTLLKLLTTMSQVLGTLLGLVGMVIIYKMQRFVDRIKDMLFRTNHARASLLGADTVNCTGEDFIKRMKTYMPIEEQTHGFLEMEIDLRQAESVIIKLISEKTSLQQMAKSFFIFNFLLLFLLLLVIPFIKQLFFLKEILLIIVFILLLICLFITAKISLTIVGAYNHAVKAPRSRR